MAVKQVSPEEAKRLLDSGPAHVLLDVRTVAEFDAGHVPGAKNVPILEADGWGRMQPNRRFLEILEGRFGSDARYIVCCQVGGRSQQAAEVMVAHGFSDVANLVGGYAHGWLQCGLPATCDSAPEDRYQTLARR